MPSNTVKMQKKCFSTVYFACFLTFAAGFLIFCFPSTTRAFVLNMQDSTTSPPVVSATSIGIEQIQSMFLSGTQQPPAGVFYFTGSYAQDGSTQNDWRWYDGLNGTSGGISSNGTITLGTIPITYIPDASDASNGINGGEIDGHDDLYMCITAVLDSSNNYWFLADHGHTNLPCIHFHWSGYIYDIQNTSNTPLPVIQNLQNYSFAECSLSKFDLGLCLADVAVGLFSPDQSSLSNFYSLQSIIQTKPPVGYFYLIQQNLATTSTTTSKVFSIIIPASLKTTIFVPLDIACASLVGVYFMLSFYKRLKHITV